MAKIQVIKYLDEDSFAPQTRKMVSRADISIAKHQRSGFCSKTIARNSKTNCAIIKIGRIREGVEKLNKVIVFKNEGSSTKQNKPITQDTTMRIIDRLSAFFV